MLISFQKETPSDVRLHLAAVNGDLKIIRRLLDSGKVHVDCRDKVPTKITLQNQVKTVR